MKVIMKSQYANLRLRILFDYRVIQLDKCCELLVVHFDGTYTTKPMKGKDNIREAIISYAMTKYLGWENIDPEILLLKQQY